MLLEWLIFESLILPKAAQWWTWVTVCDQIQIVKISIASSTIYNKIFIV